MIVHYQFIFDYRDKKIPFRVFLHQGTTVVRRILFLGTLQTPRLARRVASLCPADTIVVQGAPHWKADKSGTTIPDFMFRFTEAALNNILQHFTTPAKVALIAESQAAPAIIKLGVKQSVAFITIMQPLGLNSQSFPGTLTQKSRKLTRRMRGNFTHQLVPLLRDANLRHNHTVLVALSAREALLGRAANQYGAGLAYDSLPDLKKVAAKTHIILGEQDELFPPQEILPNLESHGIECASITIVPNAPHSPLSGKVGQGLLQRAFVIK